VIQAGDGKMAQRMADGLCPVCETALSFLRDEGHKVEGQCPTCNLKIVEYRSRDEKR
jgi:uncharacterized protein YbaR (Trm112 family)